MDWAPWEANAEMESTMQGGFRVCSPFQNMWKEGEGSGTGRSGEMAPEQTSVEALKLRGPFAAVPGLGEGAGPLHLGLSRGCNLGPGSSLQQRQFSKWDVSCSQQSPQDSG